MLYEDLWNHFESDIAPLLSVSKPTDMKEFLKSFNDSDNIRIVDDPLNVITVMYDTIEKMEKMSQNGMFSFSIAKMENERTYLIALQEFHAALVLDKIIKWNTYIPEYVIRIKE